MRPSGLGAQLVVCLVACGPIDGGALQAPSNACDQSACSSYKQAGVKPACVVGNVCEAQNAIDSLFFVITLPANALFASGHTFVMTNDDLLATKCSQTPQLASCVQLPLLGEIAGSYLATNGAATKVNYYLGGQFDVRSRSVPVQVSFRPAVPNLQGGLVEGGLVAMDFQPLFAVPTANDQPAYPGPVPAPAPGGDLPPDSPNVGFDMIIPIGSYEQTLAPLPPFNEAFPPVVQLVTIAGGGKLDRKDPTAFQNALLGLEPFKQIDAHPVTVTRSGGDSLEGWTLYLRDDRTKRPISSIAKLHEPAVVNLYTVNQRAPNGALESIRDDVELVMHPADPTLPDLVTSTGASGNTVEKFTLTYPLVLPLVTVRGVVSGTDGAPVPAEVTFESQEIAALGEAKDLHYASAIATTDDGTFEGRLRPGKYSAIVTPLSSSGYAKTIVDLVVDVPSKPGDVLQEGRTLVLQRPVVLRGACIATDGRPIADAEVEAHASTSLLYEVNAAARNPVTWPRTVRTRTNASGQFELWVDPSGFYDVVVRPATGTRFPWAILRKVSTQTPDLPSIAVPAPSIVDLILHDPSDIPVQRALVRAFVAVASPNPKLPPVALEIGRTETDDSGRFQLYLDGTRTN